MLWITCKDVSNFLRWISSVVFGELIYGLIYVGDEFFYLYADICCMQKA